MRERLEKDDLKSRSLPFNLGKSSFKVNFPKNDVDDIPSMGSKCSQLHHREISIKKIKSFPELRRELTSFELENQFHSEAELPARENDENMILTFFKYGRGKVGYLSLLMLILFTLSNFVLEIVDAQLHRLDSPLLYDTFSTEVLSPPFRYTKFSNVEKQNMGLGSAAISSVTEALSPILPFTGGVDLRREEHWNTTEGWFNAVGSLFNQVRDAFGLEPIKHPWGTSIPKHGTETSAKVENEGLVSLSKKKPPNHVASLSDSNLFVSIGLIKEMTLGDLTSAIRYGLESGSSNFSRSKFFDKINSRIKPIILALEKAVEKSRGEEVEASAINSVSKSVDVYGNVDALKFCATMRLFAEWRVLRQVPDGYNGYAVGMNLGKKDIIQNVAKIEKAVHEWIDHRCCDYSSNIDTSDKLADNTLRSPTLRQLLEHELEMNIHGKHRLPRLKEKTAAMGLLWVRRQLHYQTALFSNIMQVSKTFETTNQAISAAYSEVYDKFHSWPVQKIFSYSFQAAPETEVIYRFMNPHHLELVAKKARNMVSYKSASGQDDGVGYAENNSHLNVFQKLMRRIGDEWNKLHGISSLDTVSQGITDTGNNYSVEIEDFITTEMIKDAHSHISEYLGTIKPLLYDLTRLFEEMNMDDPTKV